MAVRQHERGRSGWHHALHPVVRGPCSRASSLSSGQSAHRPMVSCSRRGPTRRNSPPLPADRAFEVLHLSGKPGLATQAVLRRGERITVLHELDGMAHRAAATLPTTAMHPDEDRVLQWAGYLGHTAHDATITIRSFPITGH